MPLSIKYIVERYVPFVGLPPSDFLYRLSQGTNHELDSSVTLKIVRRCALPLDIESACEILYRLAIKLQIIVPKDAVRWTESHDLFLSWRIPSRQSSRTNQLVSPMPQDILTFVLLLGLNISLQHSSELIVCEVYAPSPK